MKDKFLFIGWYRDEEKNHDKVWGIIRLHNGNDYQDGDYCVFWGRRGRALQFKITKKSWDGAMLREAEKKMDKGYNEVLADNLTDVYPEFEHDLESTGLWAMLKA